MSKNIFKKIARGIAAAGLFVGSVIAGKKIKEKADQKSALQESSTVEKLPQTTSQPIVTQAKAPPIKKAKATLLCAWILIGYGILMMFGLLLATTEEEFSSFITSALFLFAIGVPLLIYGQSLRKKAQKYVKYLNTIGLAKDLSLETLAYSLAVSPETVASDLQEMIEKGYIVNAYVDMQQQALVVGGKTPSATVTSISNASAEQHTVECPSCGAKNTVVDGQVCSCEYCGAPLQ